VGSLTLLGCGKPPVSGGAAPTWTQLSSPAWQLGGYATTKTFSSVPAGTSGAGRLLIIAAAYADTGNGTKSLTVNGTGATSVSQSSSTPTATIAIWSFPSPGGTATIVVGDTGNLSAAGIFVGELTGVNTTASSTGTPIDWAFFSTPVSAPAETVAATGYAITAMLHQSNTNPTWAVAAETATATTATATNGIVYTMSTAVQSSSGTPTLTGLSNNFAFVGAAWGP
jgi:hypothetical protein